jgi:hypothetical protein
VSSDERKPFWRGFSRVKLPKLGVNLDSLGTAKDARTKKDCLEKRRGRESDEEATRRDKRR